MSYHYSLKSLLDLDQKSSFTKFAKSSFLKSSDSETLLDKFNCKLKIGGFVSKMKQIHPMIIESTQHYLFLSCQMVN